MYEFKDQFQSGSEKSSCFRTYTIEQGDTLFNIANKYNIPLRKLISANPQITNPNLIFPGQDICLPRPFPYRREISYVVKRGDTMFIIAKKFDISLQTLIAINCHIRCPYLIYPGMIIFVPAPLEWIEGICTYYSPKKTKKPIYTCEPDEQVLNSHNVVALNMYDFNKLRWCGGYIQIVNIEEPEKMTEAFIFDEMGGPEPVKGTNKKIYAGKQGSLDILEDKIHQSTFEKIGYKDHGYAKVKWRLIPSPCPYDKTLQYYFKEISGGAWMKIQIRNSLYPIYTVKIKKGNKFVPMKKSYSYFMYGDKAGLKKEYTFELTNCYGQTIIDENVPVGQKDTTIIGHSQFERLHHPF